MISEKYWSMTYTVGMLIVSSKLGKIFFWWVEMHPFVIIPSLNLTARVDTPYLNTVKNIWPALELHMTVLIVQWILTFSAARNPWLFKVSSHTFKNRSIFIEMCVLTWLRYTWVIKKENSPVSIHQCKNTSTMLGIYNKII